MAVEYLGLSAINGPLVVLEGVRGASYDEIVEMTVGGNEKKLGRIVLCSADTGCGQFITDLLQS